MKTIIVNIIFTRKRYKGVREKQGKEHGSRKQLYKVDESKLKENRKKKMNIKELLKKKRR